ncbi:helix-turn-helix domain-containing protein [Luteirhabdus pelagi]|uniref:helix-turn-helix domain-containing protein n=1 Tax=Luteirhabdus pelagi TaxID=2792783 RepID=UPI00193A8E92|nr:AraC family transcriptional regulator [Luteirhabdus pelagi]
MNTINVVSLPLKDVIRDFAKAFNTTYSENCHEYTVTLPQEWGEGQIKGINFKEGLGIIQYDCTFKEDISIHFTVRKVHPLKFLYCVNGRFEHIFEEGDDIHEVQQYQGCIVASQNHLGHILRFKGGEHIMLGSLEIVRNDFRSQMKCEFQDIDPALDSIFKDREGEKSFFYKGYFSLEISNIFQEIRDFENNDLIKKIYLEGKAYNILAQQIIEYHDDVNGAKHYSIARQKDVDTIYKTARYIKEHLYSSLEVKDLSETFQISEKRLQNGFKVLYGKTVNEYVQSERLDSARLLLADSELNISEVGHKIGITNRSYFSKMFRDKYGMTPSEFLKNHRK